MPSRKSTKTIPPIPPKGHRRPSLHVLRNKNGESFVWWSQGKWVFWIGNKRNDRRSPEETAKFGWKYVRPVKKEEL